jgi:hypothetical protein
MTTQIRQHGVERAKFDILREFVTMNPAIGRYASVEGTEWIDMQLGTLDIVLFPEHKKISFEDMEL